MEIPRYAQILCIITTILLIAAYGNFLKWLFENHSHWWAVPMGLLTAAFVYWQDREEKKEAEAQAEWEEFWGNDWWDETEEDQDMWEEDSDIIDGEYRAVPKSLLLESRSVKK